MKLVATRQLNGYPLELATLADEVLVQISREGVTFLESYDARLTLRWSKRLEAGASVLLTVNQTPWVFDPEGAWACGDGGECLARVRARPHEGMRLAALGPVSDGFVFAWQHDIRTPMRPPVLERVDHDGTIRWSVVLPVGSVGYKGVVQMRADKGWKPRPMNPWVPETWFSTSQRLTVSGDAVLVCFNDMPRSGIGFGYVVCLTDGALRFLTQRGPISKVAALGEGAFLVGYQGYGAFETLQYDRDGCVPERWSSHGYYVIDESVRVIELENTIPSKMHLARLLPGGTVKKGDWLDGYYTSEPLLGSDGIVYFFRNGVVRAARGLVIVEQLALTAPDNMLVSTEVVGGERGFYLAYARIGGRDGSLVRIDL